MAASISPYGYDPAMLAAVNAIPSSEDPGLPPSTSLLSQKKASLPPEHSCPLLKIPYEIHARILSYILPCTIRSSTKEVVWLRGNTAIFSTCRTLYEICKVILYGSCVFLIDVHFDRIIFNYQWLIATDVTKANYGCNLGPEYATSPYSHKLIPSQKVDFISKFSLENRAFMKNFVLRMHLVDGYEGMIKYNTAKEEVLAMGMVKQFEQFFHGVRFDQDNDKNRRATFKLLGTRSLQDKFRKACACRVVEIPRISECLA